MIKKILFILFILGVSLIIFNVVSALEVNSNPLISGVNIKLPEVSPFDNTTASVNNSVYCNGIPCVDYLLKAGGTMTGALEMGSNTITTTGALGSGAITGTSYSGVGSTNLLDKSATESITGSYSWASGSLFTIDSGVTTLLNSNLNSNNDIIIGGLFGTWYRNGGILRIGNMDYIVNFANHNIQQSSGSGIVWNPGFLAGFDYKINTDTKTVLYADGGADFIRLGGRVEVIGDLYLPVDNDAIWLGDLENWQLKHNQTGVYDRLLVGSRPRFFSGFSRYDFDNDVNVLGTTELGNATGNFTVDSQGRVSLTGTAKIHQHLSIQNANLGKGNTAPTQIIAGNYNGWEYTINDDSVLDIEFPHDFDTTEDASIHLSWFVDEAFASNSGEVQWEVNFSLTPHDETESILNPTHTGVVVSGDINIPTNANNLAHTTNLLIKAGNFTNDEHDVMGVTIKRIAINGGNNPTADPTILGVHLEYIADGIGSY